MGVGPARLSDGGTRRRATGATQAMTLPQPRSALTLARELCSHYDRDATVEKIALDEVPTAGQ
jgi:hypothetical protein